MTPRQKQVLDLIATQIAETGVCPTYEELQRATGLKSKSGIFRIVEALIRKGKLAREPGGRNCARSFFIPAPGPQVCAPPISPPIIDLSDVESAQLVAELESRGWSHG